MKLVLPKSNVVQTNADLKAIPTASISNFELKYVLDDVSGFQFLSIAEQGVHKPNDNNSNFGYWKADSENVLKSLSYLVHDNHVIETDEHEIIDVSILNYAHLIGKIDIYTLKNILEVHILPTWNSQDYTDKKTMTQYLVTPDSELDPGFNMGDYWSPTEVDANKTNLIEKNIDAAKARFKALRRFFRIQLLDDTFPEADAMDLYDTVKPMFDRWMDVGNTEVFDYFKSEGSHSGNGFSTRPYYSEQMKDAILSIIEHGLYTNPDLTVI